MYGTHLSLTAVHTILRENHELCLVGAFSVITNLQKPSFEALVTSVEDLICGLLSGAGLGWAGLGWASLDKQLFNYRSETL